MKKQLLTFGLLISCFAVSFAQTTALDFTASDCSGNSHNLYTELNSGKVIVLNWVMPCASCIGPSMTAFNIAQSYASSNPGKVLYYLIDDVGNSSCTIIDNWANNNSIGPADAIFSTTDIVETNYGSIGMPHVVVVGGAGHTIYFNDINAGAGNVTDIQNAINQALLASGIAEATRADAFHISVLPNPTSDNITVSFYLVETSEVTLEIINELGQTVKKTPQGKMSAGNHEIKQSIRALADGKYIVRLNTSHGTQLSRFAVSR